jgi:large conductance mechanosensitive channel
MPLVGIILGGVDFTKLMVQVGSAQLKYGNFIQAIVYFLIIAFILFLVVRSINKMKKPVVAAPAGPTTEEKLLAEIRDLLKKR